MRTRLLTITAAVLAALPCPAHDGLPDHPPQHGGIVFTAGDLDAEFVISKSPAKYQIYFTDVKGEEIPASMARAVTLGIRHETGAEENLALHLDDAGESWTGSGQSLSLKGVMLSYSFRGKGIRTEIPLASVYHAEFKTLPAQPMAGQATQLVFTIQDFFGKNVRNLQIVHEKPMHLMIVSKDLSEFYHIHPEPSAGTFRVAHIFRAGGEYRLFADFTPVGAPNKIEPFVVKVQGPQPNPVPLETSSALTGEAGGVKTTLTLGEPLRTGRDTSLSFSLADAATGAPVRNLQRYLGAWAHIAIISQVGPDNGIQDFIHVHPIDEEAKNGLSPSAIRTVTGFRRAGLYKMWIQFQKGGKVNAVPFVLRVSDGTAPVSTGPRPPKGAILIRVSSAGFEPYRIPAKAGQPMKLAFYRVDAQNCGREVIFPALGIQKALPPGETVVIDVTPKKSGSLGFSCGMKMLKGELLVQ